MNQRIDIFKDFFKISSWQSLLAVLIFAFILIGFYFFIKKTKIYFAWRIFIGLGLGIVFGLAIQSILNFPEENIWDKKIKEQTNENYIVWVNELKTWIGLLKTIFINGMLMLAIPVVFLAIARVVAKPQTSNLFMIGLLGVIGLLINVAIAYAITFSLGYAFDIGQGLNLEPEGSREGIVVKALPQLISDYLPTSFIGVFTKATIIPVMVLGCLVGYAIKKSTKRHPEQMTNARNDLDRFWTIVVSILIVFIKFMPYAVFSMMSLTIISGSMIRLVALAKLMAVAYLSLFLTLIWQTLSLMFVGINPFIWWKKVFILIFQGFITQSFQAVIPEALKVMSQEVKTKESVSNFLLPLSSTMGLAGCAGVQSGIVLMFVYNGSSDISSQYSILIYFLLGLITTLIISLGIAGVPGTAPLVTAGVLSGLGFSNYYSNVYNYLGSLKGILDMGRTAVNVMGGVQITTIVSKLSKNLDNKDLILFKFKK